MNTQIMLSRILQAIVDAPVWCLLLLKITAILGLAWLVHLALFGANPRWRVLLWRMTAAGLIALPAIVWLFPAMEIRVRPSPENKITANQGGSSQNTHLTNPPLAESLNSNPTGESGKRFLGTDSKQFAYDPGGMDAINPSRSGTPQFMPPQSTPPRERTYPTSLQNMLLTVWLGGVFIFVLRACIGQYRIWQIARRAEQSPESLRSECGRVAGLIGCATPVEIVKSEKIRSPLLCGLWCPLLLLPARMCEASYRGDLPGIFAHELTHVRCHDLFWNAGLHVISILLWFHPLAWRLRKAHLAACELVCDAVSAGFVGDVNEYCRTLARVAVDVFSLHPAAGIAMARLSTISRRLNVLKKKVFNVPLRRRSVLGFGFITLLVVAVLGVLQFALAAPPAGESAPTTVKPIEMPAKPPESAAKPATASPLSMSAAEFSRLTDAEQRDVLTRAFQQHLDLSKNLFFESNMTIRSYENKDGDLGKLLNKPPYMRSLCRYWRLGDSFKKDECAYDSPDDASFSSKRSEGVNAEERIARNTSISNDGEWPPQGQVQYPFAPFVMSTEYLYWLDGLPELSYWRHNNNEEYLFRVLIDHKDAMEIQTPIKGKMVQISVPWRPWGNKPVGTRVYQLDPQKGFLPVRCDARFVVPAGGSRPPIWEVLNFVVNDSRQVGDVWMPVKLKESISSSGFSEMIQITEIDVARIESGKVKPADLVVPFTEGMQIQDVIEGVTYTCDAQGNPAGSVKDVPNWKHEPPQGWHKGEVDEAYSLASKISPASREQLEEERIAKWKPIQDALEVLKADPPASQDERIEAALQILRVYRISEREESWATAIRELITIGKPAIPKLIEELDRTESDKSLRALGFVLRGIGDPRAVPALIRAIPRLIQPPSSDFGLTIKGNPELLKFMWTNDEEHIGKNTEGPKNNGLTLFSYGRPIREIMSALEKITGQSFGWQELRSADFEGHGINQIRLQRTLFLNHAEKWAKWWSKNWQNYAKDETDAQIELTQKSLDKFAESIAKMPQQSMPTEIPCGLLVKLGEGFSNSRFESYIDLDAGRHPSQPKDLIKNSPKDNPSPELLAWAEREGIDLLRIEIKLPNDNKTYFGFKPVGLKVWRIDNKRFKNLEKELHENKKLELPALWDGPISSLDEKTGRIDEKEPASFLFITHEGTCGAMQIRSGAVRDSTPGLPVMGPFAFEYKLIYESEPEKP